MINIDENAPSNKQDVAALFLLSDREILEKPVSTEVMENAEAARDRIFEDIAKRIDIETAPKEDVDVT